MNDAKQCPKCLGTGWIIEKSANGPVAKRCACYHERQAAVLLEKANIPKRYRDCTLANFEIHKDNDSHKDALAIAKKFVKNLPRPGDRPPVHRALRRGEDAPGRRHHPGAHQEKGRRLRLLRFPGPHPGDPEHVLAGIRPHRIRYPRPPSSGARSSSSMSSGPSGRPPGSRKPFSTSSTTATTTRRRRSSRRTTRTPRRRRTSAIPSTKRAAIRLVDRIGVRLRSRVYEMCKIVEMDGDDYRKEHKPGSYRF